MLNFFAVVLGAVMSTSNGNFLYHHQVVARPGDGPIRILDRYNLGEASCNMQMFYELNRLEAGDPLLAGTKYFLPVRIYRYDGKSIRSTIGDNDYEKALRIQQYNRWLLKNQLRKRSYEQSKILWVPYHELNCAGGIPPNRTQAKPVAKSLHLPLLGKLPANVKLKSDRLQGKVFYLIAGHGGPDPGAIGRRGKTMLCEDEYAYDVTLRLYQLLRQHGAKAYMIVQDINDGIREDEILLCDHDEKTDETTIPLNQLKRLQQRTAYVNSLYAQHRKKGILDQTAISIHVDSRGVNHQQDVFFYHCPGSKSSRQLAQQMQKTFQRKYRQHRKGNTYQGHVEARNLFVLKNTVPKALFVELANIQNKSDHRRILQPSNRQALANWMLEGILQNHREVAAK